MRDVEDAARPLDAVHAVRHVHGQPDGSGEVRHGARDRLLDPVVRIRGEAAAVLRIELLHRRDQPERSLLDQVLDVDAAVHILFGDRDHQPEVGRDHAILGVLEEPQV